MKASYILFCLIILIACRENISFKKTAISTHGDTESREEVKKPDTNYIQIIPLGLGVIKFIFSNDSAENNIKFSDSLFNLTFEINAEHVSHTKATSLALSYNDNFYLLVFNVFDTLNGYYKIGGTTSFQNFAYLPKADKRFKFESWSDHILNLFSVDFNTKYNPIKKQPSHSSESIVLHESVYGGYTFFPVEIKNDWLKIKWKNDFEKDEQTGWIKWRDGNYLIIELFYFA